MHSSHTQVNAAHTHAHSLNPRWRTCIHIPFLCSTFPPVIYGSLIYEGHLICMATLQWPHGRDGFSNHQSQHCLLNHLFRRRWKKASKLRVTGLCAGNSPVTGEFPTQMASNAENVSISWRHHEMTPTASNPVTSIPTKKHFWWIDKLLWTVVLMRRLWSIFAKLRR